MSSLDINASLLEEHGKQLFSEWEENLNYFYEQAKTIEGLKIIDKMEGMDWTKLNFSLGMQGAELEEILMEHYGIFIELYTGELVMCMTGIGNTREHMEKLVRALSEIAAEMKSKIALEEVIQKSEAVNKTLIIPKQAELFDIPKYKKRVPLMEAGGMICASSIIPYPPGIPLICPGEKLNAETLNYIKTLRELGEKVIGVNEQGEIFVGV